MGLSKLITNLLLILVVVVNVRPILDYFIPPEPLKPITVIAASIGWRGGHTEFVFYIYRSW